MWHRRLGHPSSQILLFLVRKASLPCQTFEFNKKCNACSCNKIHKLPFSISTLHSTKPLELIYIYVWGPTTIVSKERFKYYVSFIDHYTRYIWYYPMAQKYDVYTIFPKFKAIVKKCFNHQLYLSILMVVESMKN